MDHTDPTGTDWTRSEIDLIVAAYFEMLSDELAGKPFVKSHRNQMLQNLTGRSRGSIEYKMQNISAVMERLGLPWIGGYKPMANFQRALLQGIEQFLSARSGFVADLEKPKEQGFAEETGLFFEAPPVLSSIAVPKNENLERLVRKFDPASRDARNRALGKRGEERILNFEIARLSCDRPDLAKKVRWVSQEDGDGAGFDILSFETNGNERLLEVKTTTGSQITPFFITSNELELSRERPNCFRLVRLYDFSRNPKAFELRPPLSESLILKPAIHRASFQ